MMAGWYIDWISYCVAMVYQAARYCDGDDSKRNRLGWPHCPIDCAQHHGKIGRAMDASYTEYGLVCHFRYCIWINSGA